MENVDPSLVPKIHPASREQLPDDPLNLHALEVPGDPDLMLRLLVEEYARMGCDDDAILRLRDPFYTAFHGLWQLFGEEEMRRRVRAILARVGVMRIRKVEAPLAEQLVQIELR